MAHYDPKFDKSFDTGPEKSSVILCFHKSSQPFLLPFGPET